MREKGGSDGGAVVDSNSPKRRLDSLYPPRVGALRALPIDFSPLMDPMVRFLTPKGPTELLTHMMDRASSGRITACPVFLYVNHFLTQNSDFNIVCDHLCYVFRENGSISAKSLFTTTHNSKASLMESVKTCDSLPEFYADRIQSQLAEKGVVDKELSTRWTDVMKELYESYVTPIVKYLPSPKISKKPIYIVDCRHLTVLKDMEDVPQVVEAQINRRETTDAKSSPPPDTHKYPRQPGAVRWFGGYTNKRLETCVERWCIVGCDSPWQLVQSFENPPCSSPKTSKSLLYLYDSGTANTVLRTAPEWLRGDIFVNLQFRRYPLPGVVFQPREHVVVLHELDTRRSELEKVEESPLSLSSNSVVTHKRLSISGNGLSPVFVGDLRVIEECDRSLLSTYKATIFHNVDFEGNPTHKPSVNRRCYLDYFYSALVENPRWSIAALHHSAVSAVMKHGRDTKQPQPWRAVEYVLYDDGAPLSSLESLMYIDVEKKPKPTGVMFPTAKKLNPHALAPLRRTKPPEMTPIPPKTTVSLPTTPRSTKKGGRLPSLTSTEALPPTSTGSAALSDADYLEEKKVRQVFENLLVSATESNAKTEREAVDSFIRCLETNTDDSMTEVNRNVTVLKDVTNAKELCPICKEGYHHWQNCPNTAKRGKK
ncbi:hypothetical protein AGDE_16033 [Angomonas deanei]|nr:hypothetical protein AGDE_16033 [Angomonas deanei]|eukprot:EPY17860.1 hypothetical protein AGDE_16033 [Angomonas deanei]